MNDLINKSDAMSEIKRFRGYLDDDMIYRLQYSIKQLPTTSTEVLSQRIIELESENDQLWKTVRDYKSECDRLTGLINASPEEVMKDYLSNHSMAELIKLLAELVEE